MGAKGALLGLPWVPKGPQCGQHDWWCIMAMGSGLGPFDSFLPMGYWNGTRNSKKYSYIVLNGILQLPTTSWRWHRPGSCHCLISASWKVIILFFLPTCSSSFSPAPSSSASSVEAKAIFEIWKHNWSSPCTDWLTHWQAVATAIASKKQDTDCSCENALMPALPLKVIETSSTVFFFQQRDRRRSSDLRSHNQDPKNIQHSFIKHCHKRNVTSHHFFRLL